MGSAHVLGTCLLLVILCLQICINWTNLKKKRERINDNALETGYNFSKTEIMCLFLKNLTKQPLQ